MAKMRIKSIPLNLAEPGMVVAREIRNAEGQVLLPGGVPLSETSLASLRRKNIGHVSISCEDLRSADELQAERIKVAERIDHLFHNVPQDGVTGALRQMILDYRMEMLS